MRRGSTVRRERESLSGEYLGDREEFQPEESEDVAEIRNDFWPIQGNFIYRHHIEPRVQLYVPWEESFPFPLKYIDVTRSTHTDVAHEKRIDDYWNVVKNRSLSDSWTGYKRFTLLDETPPKGSTRDKQEWAIEKPKLEYARNLREIYSVDPSDEEYKDIIKNARRKLKRAMAAAMPCKRAFSQGSIWETVV